MSRNQGESGAFKAGDSGDRVNENTAKRLFADVSHDADVSDKGKGSAPMSDAVTSERAQAALGRLAEASRANPELVRSLINASEGIFSKELLAGLDPNNPKTRDAVMDLLQKAFKQTA